MWPNGRPEMYGPRYTLCPKHKIKRSKIRPSKEHPRGRWFCRLCSTEGAKARHLIDGRRRLLYSARLRAKKSNLPIDITLNDIVIPEVCPVLRVKLEVGSKTIHQHSPTLDRIIPELGYTKGNVRVISFRANSLKQDATKEEMRLVLTDLEKSACRIQ